MWAKLKRQALKSDRVMRHRFLLCWLPGLALVGAAACGGGGSSSKPPPGASFLRASGHRIVDGDGHPVFLKGVSFGNQVWANMAIPDDHGEIDFQRLEDMGANATRFLLNHVTFEDDAAPYVYKDAGWAWIDQNVAWAKAHGIRLILNMHVPEGGFQSNGEGGALWSDATNQDRLTALWQEIARRYADEPIIAGYGLVNEPEPLASVQQWKDLAARITAAIRGVDTNHMIFAERAIAAAGNFGIDIASSFPTIDDPNVVYEFHFYDPYEYTSQLEPWNNMPDGGSYPDPTQISGVTEQWINLATFDAPTAPAGNSDWTYYEGTRITATAPNIAVGKPTLVGQAIGAGMIAFDDLSIKEYDAAGTFVREVEHVYPTSGAGWYFWSANNSGASGMTSGCKTSATCLTITGTTDDASWGGTGYYFAPTPGHQYSISGWMKGTNLPAGAAARIRLDLLGSSTPVTARDKAGLAQMMSPYLAWGAAHDVPLFLGEFGVYKACFANDKGGLAWVSDAYDLATGAGTPGDPPIAGLSYHQYHEDAFALYYGSSGPVDPHNANQPLIDLLTVKLHAVP
jgi:endoglucanase